MYKLLPKHLPLNHIAWYQIIALALYTTEQTPIHIISTRFKHLYPSTGSVKGKCKLYRFHAWKYVSKLPTDATYCTTLLRATIIYDYPRESQHKTDEPELGILSLQRSNVKSQRFSSLTWYSQFSWHHTIGNKPYDCDLAFDRKSSYNHEDLKVKSNALQPILYRELKQNHHKTK